MCEIAERLNLRVKDLQDRRDFHKSHIAIMDLIAHQTTCAVCTGASKESDTRAEKAANPN